MRILLAVMAGVILAGASSFAIVNAAESKPEAGPPKPLYIYGSQR
ncbi:MAG: hypothetical protein ABIS86_02095 [Streptosporangiaceae bacterium]